MNENEVTSNFYCEFCKKKFVRESTVISHLCKYKHRYLDKSNKCNIIAYQIWLDFYKKQSLGKKSKNYEDFIKSPYYTAFVKFASYCISINAININRYSDWLIKNQTPIDKWNTDTIYNKFLLDFLVNENHLDALQRSIETLMVMAESDGILSKDYLKYGNINKICYQIINGKISPWILFQSQSGREFMDRLDKSHIQMIFDYVDPEKWALKFHRDKENVLIAQEILYHGGY